MMDPAESQKMIEMATNIAQLNGQVAGLLDAVGSLVRHWERHHSMQNTPVQNVAAMVEAMNSLTRHWERFQLALQAQAGGGLGPGGGIPGPGGGLSGGGDRGF